MTILLKSLILVIFFAVICLYIQEGDSGLIWQPVIFFDLSILLISILLGAFLASVRLSLSSIVVVLYAVLVRVFSITILLYIILTVLTSFLLNSQIVFSIEQVGVHIMFGVLMLLLVPIAFLSLNKET